MSKVHVVTDSQASLPEELLGLLPISVVPMAVQLGAITYREGIDLDKDSLYDLLRRGEMPTTSQPSPGDFLEIFKPLVEQGKKIIGVFVTGKASGTCECARLAAEMLPEADITVFDSETAAMGTGLMAIAAAEAAVEGKTKEGILAKLEQIRSNNRVYIAVPTLKYLQKSGRVKMVQAMLGAVLNIKPILSAVDGYVVVHDKARSWQGAVQKIERMVLEGAAGRKVVLAVQHAQDPQGAADLIARLSEKLDIQQSYTSEMSASLAMHGGAGMLTVAYYPVGE